MPSIPAPVNPQLLTWLRERARLDQSVAARKAGIPLETLKAWEAGEAIPTLAKLRVLATVYNRPLDVFLLDQIPYEFSPMRDHRRLPNGETPEESPELAAEIRLAWERREVALELMAGEAQPLNLQATVHYDAETVAVRARERIGVTVPQQTSWRNSDEALKGWIAAVEALDILVFHTRGVSVSEMRGASIPEFPLPVILLNGNERSANGRIFTLMHEFAHLMLRDGGICDNSESGRTETYCNRVAAAILLPAEALRRHPLLHNRNEDSAWVDEDLAILAREFSVSEESMLRRLVTLRAASPAFYDNRRAFYLARYAEAEERQKIKDKERPAIVPYHLKVLRRNGAPFVRAVLAAMRSRRVSMRDASDFLGVRVKHLSALETALWRPRSRN